MAVLEKIHVLSPTSDLMNLNLEMGGWESVFLRKTQGILILLSGYQLTFEKQL